MWTYYAFCFPTLLLGTVKNKKRNQPFIAFDLKGFTFSFIFPLFLLVHCNIIFLKDLSCFLIFDGEINLKSEYKFQFLRGLDFHFELFFSLYHFFITTPPAPPPPPWSPWVSPHHFFLIVSSRCRNCVRLSFVWFLANVSHMEVNEWQIMNTGE